MATMSNIYCKINDIYDLMDGMAKVIVDSAFASEARDSLIKSYQTNRGRHDQLKQDERVNNKATAIQQMVEWGIHAFQGPFPWLKEKKMIRRKRRKKNNVKPYGSYL